MDLCGKSCGHTQSLAKSWLPVPLITVAPTWEEQSKKPNDYLSTKEYKDILWPNKALWLNKNCKYKFENFSEQLD